MPRQRPVQHHNGTHLAKSQESEAIWALPSGHGL